MYVVLNISVITAIITYLNSKGCYVTNVGMIVFVSDDANTTFNAFLDTYLKPFQSCFITKKVTPKPNHNPWITSGIKKGGALPKT
jgi:hypothetical protein